MLTVKARTKIFDSRPRFLGSRNPLRPSKTFYYQWFKSYGQRLKSPYRKNGMGLSDRNETNFRI